VDFWQKPGPSYHSCAPGVINTVSALGWKKVKKVRSNDLVNYRLAALSPARRRRRLAENKNETRRRARGHSLIYRRFLDPPGGDLSKLILFSHSAFYAQNDNV
jgi:hypothetical protein